MPLRCGQDVPFMLRPLAALAIGQGEAVLDVDPAMHGAESGDGGFGNLMN